MVVVQDAIAHEDTLVHVRVPVMAEPGGVRQASQAAARQDVENQTQSLKLQQQSVDDRQTSQAVAQQEAEVQTLKLRQQLASVAVSGAPR